MYEMILNSLEKGMNMTFDSKQWTTAALEDELTFCLCSVNLYVIKEDTKEIHISHKYYDQAESIIYRINVWQPPPVFVINVSDLTLRLNKELKKLMISPEALNGVVIQSIGRIFENIDERYYHLSGIMNRIKWRFEA
jgi:hypothetical protein